MKHLRSMAIVALCLCAALSAVTSFADVIFEPNDDFYMSHASDCKYTDRTFIANGGLGYANVYESPESSGTVTALRNGTEIYVSFVYTASNGAQWGVVQFEQDGEGNITSSYSWEAKSGWVKMDDMINSYDNIAFTEEHEAEFADYSDEFASYESNGKAVLIWMYPGAGAAIGKLEPDTYMEDLSFSYVYTDENDRVWGYVPYIYGMEGWICFTDPTNPDLPVNAPTYDIIPPASEADIPLTGTKADFPVLAVVLVAALAAGTALLIVLMGKKRKS